MTLIRLLKALVVITKESEMEGLTPIEETIAKLSHDAPDIPYPLMFQLLNEVLHAEFKNLSEDGAAKLIGLAAFCYKKSKEEFLESLSKTSQTLN